MPELKPLLDPPDCLLSPAFPLNRGELARLLAALRAAQVLGVKPEAVEHLSAEDRALLLRLGIREKAESAGFDPENQKKSAYDCQGSTIPEPPDSGHPPFRPAADAALEAGQSG